MITDIFINIDDEEKRKERTKERKIKEKTDRRKVKKDKEILKESEK